VKYVKLSSIAGSATFAVQGFAFAYVVYLLAGLWTTGWVNQVITENHVAIDMAPYAATFLVFYLALAVLGAVGGFYLAYATARGKNLMS
jgi:hypothetical protein